MREEDPEVRQHGRASVEVTDDAAPADGTRRPDTPPTSPASAEGSRKRGIHRFRSAVTHGAARTRKRAVAATQKISDQGSAATRRAAARLSEIGTRASHGVRAHFAPFDDLTAFERTPTPLGDMRAPDAPLPVTAVTGVALAGASVGAFTNATDLMRFTRPLMDADTAGLQLWLAEVFPAATNPAVSRAMDTVPGAEHAGGMFHRLQHGHDIEGLVAMVRAYGLDGAASWFNHVGLRDLWTPHGVPWLPAGASDVHAWLVELGMQRSLAATLLSVNAATLAGTALGLLAAGAFRSAIRSSLERGEAKARFDHACAALDAGDPITATERFEAAMRLPGTTARLRLIAAMSALEAARRSDDEETRRRVARDASYWLREFLSDRGAETRRSSTPMWAGADVSTPGIASLLYGQAIMLAHGDDANGTLEIERMRTGVAAAIEHGDRLLDPPKLGPVARPARPLSAALNYVIALETMLAYPQRLVTATAQPSGLRRQVREALVTTAGSEREPYAVRALEQMERRYPVETFTAAP